MANITEFFKALETDPKAKEKLKGMKEPDSAEEAAEQYFAIAQDLGISVSREDVTALLKANEKAHREKAAKAEEKVKEALDESALDAVAGGQKIDGCESTADLGEWCWFSDSCDFLINGYDSSSGGAGSNTFPDSTQMAGPDYMDPATGDTIWTETFDRCSTSAYDDLVNAYKTEGSWKTN